MEFILFCLKLGFGFVALSVPILTFCAIAAFGITYLEKRTRG